MGYTTFNCKSIWVCFGLSNPLIGKGLILALQDEKMEAPGGFEPPVEVLQTSALATWRRRHGSVVRVGEKGKNGAGEGI